MLLNKLNKVCKLLCSSLNLKVFLVLLGLKSGINSADNKVQNVGSACTVVYCTVEKFRNVSVFINKPCIINNRSSKTPQV